MSVPLALLEMGTNPKGNILPVCLPTVICVKNVEEICCRPMFWWFRIKLMLAMKEPILEQQSSGFSFGGGEP